jgi:hypothetical protein
MRMATCRVKNPDRVHYAPRQNYEISRLNKAKVTALSILSLTNNKNFAKKREQIIYTVLGLGDGRDIAERSRQKILSKLIYPHLEKGLKPKESKEDSNKLAEGLLTGQLSPYEATGIIKELRPELTSKEMTQLWTKFSIVTAIRDLKDGSLGVNWGEEIENKSLIPKLKSLKESLIKEEKIEDPSIITRKYYENYSHLKSSQGKETNWAEVVSNLPLDQSGFIQALLNSSRDCILKEEATKNLLWPSPVEKEIENKRLDNLLRTLGNRPTGRSQRYSRILLNESPKEFPRGIPNPTPVVVTAKEKETERKLTKELENYAFKHQETTREKPWYKIFLKIGKIKKIDTEVAKEAFTKTKQLLYSYLENTLTAKQSTPKRSFLLHMISHSDELRKELLKYLLQTPHEDKTKEEVMKEEGLSLLTTGEFQAGDIKDSTVLTAIKHLCNARDKEFSRMDIVDITLLLTNPDKFRETFQETPFSGSKCLTQWANRELEVDGPPTRFLDIYRSNTNGTKLDLSKGYGKAKLSALHLASWYSDRKNVSTGAELPAIIEQMKEDGQSLDPRDIMGNTPLHKSNEHATEILLNSGADPSITNNEGLPPSKTNFSKESCRRMLLEGIKKETIKKIAASPELEM